MIVFWIVTSGLLANLYREFCDNLKDDEECNETDERFVATPALGFICFVGWVSSLQLVTDLWKHTNIARIIHKLHWLAYDLLEVMQVCSYRYMEAIQQSKYAHESIP